MTRVKATPQTATNLRVVFKSNRRGVWVSLFVDGKRLTREYLSKREFLGRILGYPPPRRAR